MTEPDFPLPARSPEQALPSREVLRALLVRGDLDGFLDAVSPLLPGHAGDRTRENNLSGARVYLKWAAEFQRAILSPDPAQGRDYRDWLATRFAPATAKNRLSQVRRLYDVLREVGVAEINPFREAPGPLNKPEEHRDAYTPGEVTRLLAFADVQDRALILLGAHGGLTGPQVLALRFEHLRLSEGELELEGRPISGSEELLRALSDWGKRRGHTALFEGSGPIFDLTDDAALRARVYKLCREANVPYRAWRALRNHAGLRLLAVQGREKTRQHLGLAGKESLRPLVKLSGQPRRRAGRKPKHEARE